MNRKKDYRDMEKFRRTCRKQQRRYYSKTAFLYEKRYWTADEDTMVLEHSVPDTTLSRVIHRSVGAIQTRRSKLLKAQKVS